MLLAALIAIAAFGLSRFFIMRYTGDRLFATVLPGAIVVAFLLGFLCAPLFFPVNATV